MEPVDEMRGAQLGSELRVQVRGRAVSDQCPALLRFVREGLRSGAQQVRIELAGCEYGDSTFLGTLIQLLREAGACGSEGFALVAPSEPIRQSLRTMGLTRLFRIEEGLSERRTDEWLLLSSERCRRGSREFCEQVVVAHRALADTSETRGELFREIADEAARELALRPTDQ